MSKVAVVQMTSTPEVTDNLRVARSLLETAARDGAKLAALPENFSIMGLHERDKLRVAEDFGAGPIQSWLAQVASELHLWIIGGTIPLRATLDDGGASNEKVAAACLVIDAQGNRVARYDKMHLFDVDIPDRNESYRESATIAAGTQPAVVDSPVGRIGLAVCYDMRFPELFRHMVQQGAQILSLPSAFTVPTGQAHWDVLLRARAIENLCFVLAPAQTGKHANGRETYGNAMIVNPWGEVIARAGEGCSIAVAEIDLQAQSATRARFPALLHRRLQS
jgi:deaminated glutathione amidase